MIIAMKTSRITLITAFFFSLMVLFMNCGGQEQLRSKLLLEVAVKSSGQVTFQGEILLLRLYDNAEAEADFLSLQTEKETQFKRKSLSLSGTNFSEIQRLLKALEGTDFRKHYLPNAPASDLNSSTTIIFNGTEHRKIEIVMDENATGILTDTYGEKYPKAVVELLNYVHNLRRQFE